MQLFKCMFHAVCQAHPVWLASTLFMDGLMHVFNTKVCKLSRSQAKPSKYIATTQVVGLPHWLNQHSSQGIIFHPDTDVVSGSYMQWRNQVSRWRGEPWTPPCSSGSRQRVSDDSTTRSAAESSHYALRTFWYAWLNATDRTMRSIFKLAAHVQCFSCSQAYLLHSA